MTIELETIPINFNGIKYRLLFLITLIPKVSFVFIWRTKLLHKFLFAEFVVFQNNFFIKIVYRMK